MAAPTILEQEFLPLRARLLEVAAAMDRLERGGELLPGDGRVAKIRAALDALRDPGADRAEQVQLLFSRPYEDDWRENFRMTNDE